MPCLSWAHLTSFHDEVPTRENFCCRVVRSVVCVEAISAHMSWETATRALSEEPTRTASTR